MAGKPIPIPDQFVPSSIVRSRTPFSSVTQTVELELVSMAMAVMPDSNTVCQVSPASLLLNIAALPPAYRIEGEEDETARAKTAVSYAWGSAVRAQLLPPSTLLNTPPR